MRPLQIFIRYFLVLLASLLCARLAFLVYFADDLLSVKAADLFYAMWLGLRFDLRLTAICSLPIFFIMPFIKRFPKFSKYTFWLYSTAVFIFVITTYGLDFGFFSYLKTRINAASLELMENPLLSLKMISQSYSVFFLIFVVVFAAAVHYFSSKYIWGIAKQKPPRYFVSFSRKIVALVYVGLFLANALAIHGRFSSFPLRWSEAYFTNSSVVANFALNPVLNFVETYSFKDETVKESYFETYKEYIADYLEDPLKGIAGVGSPYARWIRGSESFVQQQVSLEQKPDTTNHNQKDNTSTRHPIKDKKPNIILVIAESLAANKTSLFDNKLDPTPFLNTLAKRSVFFENSFTPTTGTARGVFAILTSIPDLSFVKTGSRNPFLANQNLIFDQFKGYSKYYFIGGSANWGNIRALIEHNVDDIQLYEEDDYTSPSIDVWGISDFDLFKEAHQKLKDQTTPFVAVIQTAGFHRPYTIPKNRGDFEVKSDYSKEIMLKNGFHSTAEYNSIRFFDHSLKHFFELSKESTYLDNTIVVVVGDHGLVSSDSGNFSKGYFDLNLSNYHTPLLFYAPSLLKPEVRSDIASQVDIAPSLAGLLGEDVISSALGRNLFSEPADKVTRDHAFIFQWHDGLPKKVLIGRDRAFVNHMDNKKYYKWRPGALEEIDTANSAEETQNAEQMENMLQAIYKSSRYMMYHNPKVDPQVIAEDKVKP